MLYYLHEWTEFFSPLRVFQYITVRAFGAAATAFALSIILGPYVIAWLRKLKFGQYVRGKEEAAPLYRLHEEKEGTPTMGGVLIIGAVLVSTFLWARPTNPFVWITVGSLCYMGAVGFLDDYAGIRRKQSKGLGARQKLGLQLVWCVIALGCMWAIPASRERVVQLMVPFLKEPLVSDMGLFFTFAFISLIILGATNAVNLTDGLDGLAIGCSGTVAFSYLLMAYVAGHVEFAAYLNVPYVAGSGELAVFCGALLGACLGFLWYNCHPAKVFMGDTGSLALGGAIAMIAILIKQELVLVIVGGVFVMEAMSVIIQVVSFKSRGKRVFAMAPIHHHFELKEWSETQVTIRFWILSIIFALLGLLTLKIR